MNLYNIGFYLRVSISVKHFNEPIFGEIWSVCRFEELFLHTNFKKVVHGGTCVHAAAKYDGSRRHFSI